MILRLKKDEDDDDDDDDDDDHHDDDDEVDVDDDVDDVVVVVVVVVVWLTKAEHERFKGPKKDRLSKYFSVSSSLIILSKKVCVLETTCKHIAQHTGFECAD